MRLQDSLSILVEIGTADPVFHLPNHRNIARYWVAEVQIQNNSQTRARGRKIVHKLEASFKQDNVAVQRTVSTRGKC